MRVLVVDDTIIYRKIVVDVLSEIPDISIVGTAANGKIALQKIHLLKPDLLTLDLEMPVMGGLELLRHLKDNSSDVGVIILSAYTTSGAKLTMEALSLGAFDFVLKPQGNVLKENYETLRNTIRPVIETYNRSKQVRDILRGRKPLGAQRNDRSVPREKDTIIPPSRQLSLDVQDKPFHHKIQSLLHSTTPVEIVAIGVSTGGPAALNQVIPQLPSDLAAPVAIVQHMPPIFTKSLADDLNKSSALTVCEAENGQVLKPGFVLIAPGGKQMKIRQEGGLKKIQITNDPLENSCRPSVDYLFRSVAEVYGPKALGIIMTGMGNDGTRGCRLMKDRGAAIIAQDQASCIVFGMPKEPIELGIVDVIAPLEKMADEIVHHVGRGVVA